MPKFLLLLSFVSLSCLSAFGQQTKTTVPIEVEYLSLFKTPEQFSDKIVKASAYCTAGLEQMWLTASSPKEPETGFANVEFDPNWRENSSSQALKKFDRKMNSRSGRLTERSAKISFVGIFKVGKLTTDPRPIYTIRILSIQ